MCDSEYKILDHVIGKGSFGVVYLGMHKSGKLVAIKTEEKGPKRQILNHEYSIIRSVCKKPFMPPGVNKSCYFWEDPDKCYLAIDLMGPNLDSLHKICKRTFSLKTTLMLAEQMINLIRFYHNNDIIHRDIKPSNFLVGYDVPHKHISLVDFGLSKKYRIKGKQNPYTSGALQVGSLRYMSKYIHCSIEPSCRDDMYSLGYCFIFLFTGMLPWQTNVIGFEKKKRKEYVSNLKQTISNKELVDNCSCFQCKKCGLECCFKQYMKEYFDYLDTLKYESKVDYDTLIIKLKHVAKQHSIKFDYNWDWNKFYILPSVSTGI